MKIRRSILSFFLFWIASSQIILFTNCSGTSSLTTAPPSNQIIEKKEYDPWNPPLGELISSVTVPDGWDPVREVEGINVTGGWTDSVAVSSDGKSLLFAYSRFDFYKMYQSIMSGGPINKVITGPLRLGMIGNEFKMFQADLTSTGWNVSFHSVNEIIGDIPQSSASMNVDQDVLVYTRWDPTTYQGDIYYSLKNSGSWSAGVKVPGINSSCNDDNAFVVGNISSGLRIYFESDRTDEAASSCNPGIKHFYYSDYSPVEMSPPRLVPGLSNSEAGDYEEQPFVCPDKNQFIFTAKRTKEPFYGIKLATWNGSLFQDFQNLVYPSSSTPPFHGKLVFIGEANQAQLPQGTVMYMMCGVAYNESNGHTYYDSDTIRLKICFTKKPKH